MEEVKENEMLGAFKAFLDVPCEICHEPVKEWDEQNAWRESNMSAGL
jgi:hypothetical protein